MTWWDPRRIRPHLHNEKWWPWIHLHRSKNESKKSGISINLKKNIALSIENRRIQMCRPMTWAPVVVTSQNWYLFWHVVLYFNGSSITSELTSQNLGSKCNNNRVRKFLGNCVWEPEIESTNITSSAAWWSTLSLPLHTYFPRLRVLSRSNSLWADFDQGCCKDWHIAHKLTRVKQGRYRGEYHWHQCYSAKHAKNGLLVTRSSLRIGHDSWYQKVSGAPLDLKR